MVSELHRMGYQRLRLMPYLHPNAWRLAVAPKELFSDRNGAFVPHGKLGDSSVAIYSAAGGGVATSTGLMLVAMTHGLWLRNSSLVFQLLPSKAKVVTGHTPAGSLSWWASLSRATGCLRCTGTK